MKFHRCAAPGCLTQVPMHMMMCGSHWLRLPPTQRERIYDAYKGTQLGKPGAEETLRREARAAIRTLREATP